MTPYRPGPTCHRWRSVNVQAASQQRHRAGQLPGDDLHDHHRGRQHHYPTPSALVVVMGVAEKDVGVTKLGSSVGVHPVPRGWVQS